MIGDKIMRFREAQGLSQEALADKLEYLNQSQISKIEKGKRKLTAQDLIEIAKVLNVTVEEIISGNKTA